MRPESFPDYFGILRRRGFVIVLTALLVSGGVMFVGLRLPRSYSASLLVDVDTGQKASQLLLPNLVQSALSGGSDPVMMQTLASRLSAMTLLERVRQDFADAEPVGSKLLPPVSTLAKSIRASVETGSRLLRISVEMRESEGGARNAALFANQLIETFRAQLAEEEQNDRQQEAQIQLDLINAKRTELEGLLDTTRRDLLAFVRQQGSPTLWSAELTQAYQHLEGLIEQKRDGTFRRQQAEVAKQINASTLANQPELIVSSKSETAHPMRTKIEGELLTTEALSAQKEGEDLAEGAPERLGLLAQKRYLEKRLKETPEQNTVETYGVNPRRSSLADAVLSSEILLTSVGAQVTALDDLIQHAERDLRARSARIPENETQLAILQRQAESLAHVYDELLLRQNQAELALGEVQARQTQRSRRVGGIALVDAARPQLRPIRPRLGFLMGAGTVFGLLVGIGLALLMEWGVSSRHETLPEDLNPPGPQERGEESSPQ